MLNNNEISLKLYIKYYLVLSNSKYRSSKLICIKFVSSGISIMIIQKLYVQYILRKLVNFHNNYFFSQGLLHTQ